MLGRPYPAWILPTDPTGLILTTQMVSWTLNIFRREEADLNLRTRQIARAHLTGGGWIDFSQKGRPAQYRGRNLSQARQQLMPPSLTQNILTRWCWSIIRALSLPHRILWLVEYHSDTANPVMSSQRSLWIKTVNRQRSSRWAVLCSSIRIELTLTSWVAHTNKTSISCKTSSWTKSKLSMKACPTWICTPPTRTSTICRTHPKPRSTQWRTGLRVYSRSQKLFCRARLKRRKSLTRRGKREARHLRI